MPGGGGHGGHGRGGGHGGPPSAGAPAPPRAPDKPASQVDIVGVVKAVDQANGRITISYEEVEALNWPAGTMPFAVAKTALLQQATVGEKVRFRIDSQEITVLEPWTAKPGPPDGAADAGPARHWRGPRSGGPGGTPPGGPPQQ